MNFLGIRGAGAALLLVLLIAAAQLQVSQSRSLRPSSYFEEDQQLIDDDSNEFADSDCDDLDSVDDCGDDTRREPPARADDDWVRSEPSRRSDLRKRYDRCWPSDVGETATAAVTNADFSDRQAGSDATTRCSSSDRRTAESAARQRRKNVFNNG
uniref:Secreted protein n=1 Tax=Macrostomum lignano TaxID=282301 RepID=A0A1I8IWE6_9PLAT